MDRTVSIVLGLAGFLIAFGVVWKVVRYVFRVDKAMPILLSIAAQFETNGGSTLKDSINKIAKAQEELAETVQHKFDEQTVESKLVLKIAEDSRLVANTNAKIVNELALAQTDDIKHIKAYLHEKMHDLNNSISITNMQANLTEKRSLRIEQRLDDIIPFVKRHREDYEYNDEGEPT